MHTVSEPIPISRVDNINSFGESAELVGSPASFDRFPRSTDDAVKEEAEEDFPVDKLCSESVESSVAIEGGQLFLTNYRIVITERNRRGIASIPVVGVESVEARDTRGLQITCKYGRIYNVTVLNGECACEWYKKLSQKTVSTRRIEDIFAWEFAKLAKQGAKWLTFKSDCCDMESSGQTEFDRLGYDSNWRVSEANEGFRICNTYPQKLIVPKVIPDEDLPLIAEARTLSRFPVAVWYCKEKKTVLMRSSQPRVGFFSYRYEHDERLIEYVRDAVSEGPTTLLIIDARSYTAALGNRAKGGGVELPDYYKQTEVEYKSLPNIHNIRYAFHQLRAVLQNKDDLQFHMALQNTNWFPYLYSLINSAFRCVRALRDEGRSVLVHCSDGWDRTTQITTLAKIIADPYYRTFEGFRDLIQRDWIEFGHKFRDRLGILNRDPNEVSPVFLQWLDCVYQLHQRNVLAFQFSTFFLTQLAMHAYSGLFGTFLWNSWSDKKIHSGTREETLSVWSYLNLSEPRYKNFMYNSRSYNQLPPLNGLVDLVLWKELYLCSRSEQIINEPDTKGAGSLIVDGLRSSLYRSHSAESLSNTDGSNFTSNLISGDKGQSILIQTPGRAEEESYGKSGSHDFRNCQNLVDISGVPKIDDLMEEIRLLMQEKEAELRKAIGEAQNHERGRFSEVGRSQFNISGGDLNTLNGSSMADEDPESSSLNSFTSVELVNKEDVPDNYDGCKGQMIQNSSNSCMGCFGRIWIRGLRNCGMRGNKGERVKACNSCYDKMASDSFNASSSQNTPTQPISVLE